MMEDKINNKSVNEIDGAKFKSDLDKLLQSPNLEMPKPTSTAPSIDKIVSLAEPLVARPEEKESSPSSLRAEPTLGNIESLENLDDENSPPSPMAEKNSSQKSYLVPMLSMLAMLSAAVAAYAVYQNFTSITDIENVPILLADTSAVRKAPQQTGGLEIGEQNHSVYEQVLDATKPKAVETKIIASNRQTQTDILPTTFTQAQAATPTPAPTVPQVPKTLVPKVAEPLVPVTKTSEAPEQPSGSPAGKPDEPEITAQIVAEVESENETEIATAIPRNIGNPRRPNMSSESPRLAKPVASGKFAVQLASLRSRQAAQISWRNLSTRYSNLLANYIPDIRRVELQNKGVFFRLRVLAETRQQAQTLCQQIKSAGGDCLVTK